MSTTDVNICNMALRHLAVGKAIGTLAEPSAEARACTTFYEAARDETLRDFDWPFAKARVTLALVEEQPNVEWAFSYRYPANCAAIRRIPSGMRQETRASVVKLRIGRDDTGRLIYTDQPDAEVEYTYAITDAGQFDADFAQAVALKLAGYIAPSVTGGDPTRLGLRALELYQVAIGIARSNAANEEQADEEPDSPSILARL